VRCRGCLAPHAAALVEEIRLPVGGAGGGVHQHDVEGLERVADAVELTLHVVGGAHVAVR
jgi:hypothetical protein